MLIIDYLDGQLQCILSLFLQMDYIELEIMHIRGPFEKFADSPYYSKSELSGGAVMVLFQSTSLGK
jgi:hypothetical protein